MTMLEILIAAAGALVLAGVHVLTPVLDRLSSRAQAALASFAGGAGLAYVTLYLLYELAYEGAEKIHELLPLGPAPLESLFILLLVALALNYVIQMQLQQTPDRADDHAGHALLFLLYNFLAGGAVVEEARWGILNLGFYVTALGMHILFNDVFLHHVCASAHTWRWRVALAGSPLLGFAFVVAFNVPDALLYLMLAYVAGGTIINVLRLELPEVERFRPWPFIAGIVTYAVVVLGTWRF